MYSVVIKTMGGVLLLISSSIGFAQHFTHRYEVGVTAGTLVYQGDLTPSDAGSYQTLSPGIGLFASRILNRSFSARANIFFGKLEGNDALYDKPEYRKQRNFSFSTPVNEITGSIIWNILSKNGKENISGFSPYVFAGAGISMLHISRDRSNFNAEYFNSESVAEGLAVDFAHRTPASILVFPAGAGLRYVLTPQLSITAETGYRFLLTDYLDGFSRAANPYVKDSYHCHSIGFIFSLGSRNRYSCPPVKL